MIVICPKCKSRFRLNPYEANAVKNQGRIFHCGKCEHEWEVKKIQPPKIPTKQEEKLRQDREKVSAAKTERILKLTRVIGNKYIEEVDFIDGVPLKVKIIFLLLLFVTMSLMLVQNHKFVKHLLPRTEGFYQLIGVYDNKDIEIERVTISKDTIFDEEKLVLSGYVVNNSDQAKHTPDLRITFLDKDMNVIKTIYSDLPNKELIPVDKSKISLKMNNYPLNSHYIAFDIGNYLELLLR